MFWINIIFCIMKLQPALMRKYAYFFRRFSFSGHMQGNRNHNGAKSFLQIAIKVFCNYYVNSSAAHTFSHIWIIFPFLINNIRILIYLTALKINFFQTYIFLFQDTIINFRIFPWQKKSSLDKACILYFKFSLNPLRFSLTNQDPWTRYLKTYSK